jgi:hypothetical protein
MTFNPFFVCKIKLLGGPSKQVNGVKIHHILVEEEDSLVLI